MLLPYDKNYKKDVQVHAINKDQLKMFKMFLIVAINISCIEKIWIWFKNVSTYHSIK